MYINHRFRSQVANARLELHTALLRDHQQAVKSDGAANVATERNADAAHLGSYALRVACRTFLPAELLRAAIERLFQEAAGSVSTFTFNFGAKFGFAFRAVHSPYIHLV